MSNLGANTANDPYRLIDLYVGFCRLQEGTLAQTRTQLQADLLTLWGLGRKTIIFVTHDITEAIALGDRALVLSRQPTRIAAEHAIPIPRPRNVQDIFALEGFAAVHQRIRSEIQ